eukprot:TRINITY_DN33837_c0_g1_i1.p1 TRINITY_DN33837_c0_g1~~TRINITY_DN33837_c0_g1_i1.p1  ORF type:complete len:101 (-),score=23.07 TRINITY_DN33837_c0_g1_i1:440-742(-)
MRGLVKKLHLCLTCLSVPGKDHKCPVGKCRNCGCGHNIILCPKKEDEKTMLVKVVDDETEEDSEDEAYDDFLNNRDNIHFAKDKTGGEKEKPTQKRKERK